VTWHLLEKNFREILRQLKSARGSRITNVKSED
jgi:hypothetical protein